MSFFLSTKSKMDRSRVHDWLSIVHADGHTHRNEVKFISELAANHGVKQSDFEAVLKNPGRVKLVPVGPPEQHLQHFLELVTIMLIDGEFSVSELDMIKQIGVRHGFPASAIDRIVEDMLLQLNVPPHIPDTHETSADRPSQ